MQTIPLQPVPNQSLQTQVAGQTVTMFLHDKRAQGLFVDIVSNGEPLITSVLALDAVPLIPTTYLGFAGNFLFVDTLGSDHPAAAGLGTRWQLLYLTAAEYALISQ